MSTLPFTLPTCDRPATVRIELYSPADGMAHGSLDGAVYTCDQHVSKVVSAIHAAGLTAYRVPMAPDTPATTCGHVYVFPTGNLAGGTVVATVADETDDPPASDDQTTEDAPAAPEHPTWCDRQNCERRGEHRSAVAHIDTNRPEATIVDLALIQSLHPAGEPMLSLTSIEGPAAEHLIMSIGQGRALTYVMRRLIDATKGGRR